MLSLKKSISYKGGNNMTIETAIEKIAFNKITEKQLKNIIEKLGGVYSGK